MRTLGFRALAVSAVLGVLGLAHSAIATPVTMNYCVEDEGNGLYLYTFTMTLDNHDGTWAPGYGIGWIIFGDSPSASPISDFNVDPSTLPIGPWTGVNSSGGGHNGPTLEPVVVQDPPYPNLYWIPNAVGDSLTWRGESANLVTPDQMQWSDLEVTPGGASAIFEPMTHLCGPMGGCCLSTGCQVLPEADCTAMGGTYSGDGTDCSACPAAGACCTSSGCTQLTQAACATAGGHWQGANTSCPAISYAVSNSSGAFVDISGTGTDVTSQLSNCDDGGITVSIPFDFTFYGNSFNSVWFCTNGFMQFGGANRVDYANGNPPAASDPGNAIYPMWDDLILCTIGNMYYEVDGTAPNRTMTFSWQNAAKFSDQGDGTQNFQAILYEGSNNIEFRYGNLTPDAGGGGGPGGGDYTIGVENSNGTAAVTVLGSDIGSGNTARMLAYSPGNCGPACGSADFNCDGDVGTDQDIEAFFACLAGSCPSAPCTNSADFNGDGDIGTDQDIEAFFRVLAGGNC